MKIDLENVHYYDNPGELLQLPVKDHEMWQSLQGRKRSGAWFGRGVYDIKEAIAKCDQPWPDGANKALEYFSDIKVPRVTKRRRRPTRGDFGDEVDLQKLYKGETDTAWKTRKRQTMDVGRKNIHVVVQVNENCRTDADSLFWRGAAALALVKGYRGAGYNVQVSAIAVSRGVYRRMPDPVAELVTVKHYHDPLNVEMLASILCFAGFFRGMVFYAKCCHRSDCSANLGYSVDAGPFLSGKDYVLIPRINTQHKAQEFISNVLSN